MLTGVTLWSSWLLAWLCVCLLYLFVGCGAASYFCFLDVVMILPGCVYVSNFCNYVNWCHPLVFLAVCLAVCMSPISVTMLTGVTLWSSWLFAWLCVCLQFL